MRMIPAKTPSAIRIWRKTRRFMRTVRSRKKRVRVDLEDVKIVPTTQNYQSKPVAVGSFDAPDPNRNRLMSHFSPFPSRMSVHARSVFLALPLFALFVAAASPALAQERGNEETRASPNAAVSQTIGTTEVRLTYGRPSMEGRTIFAEEGLVPYGEVWRTGANEATTISFSSDVTIEGEPLSAGTYSLYTIPGPDTWTLIFNNVANQWGTNYNESKDALRVEVSSESGPQVEMMMFYFEGVTDTAGTCVLHWADVRVPFEIQVADS